METELTDRIKQIKRSFRLRMNGVTSKSMRDKGIAYKINWGISLIDLRAMAAEYGKDVALATALWQEDIRECKVLATLIMPAEDMSLPVAMEWSKGIKSQEMAELIAFNLFQHSLDAAAIANELIHTNAKTAQGDKQDTLYQRIAAYQLLCRLVKQGKMQPTHIQQYIYDDAAKETPATDAGLLRAIANSMMCIAEKEENEDSKANMVLKKIGFDAF